MSIFAGGFELLTKDEFKLGNFEPDQIITGDDIDIAHECYKPGLYYLKNTSSSDVPLGFYGKKTQDQKISNFRIMILTLGIDADNCNFRYQFLLFDDGLWFRGSWKNAQFTEWRRLDKTS